MATFNGTAGNDSITGTAFADTINGFAGDDILLGGDGFDVINGGDGGDFLSGGNGDDSITGGASNDEIYGGNGADWLEGNDGSDILIGNTGNDVLLGGAGADSLNVSETTQEINEVKNLYGGSGLDSFRYTMTGETESYVVIRDLEFGEKLTLAGAFDPATVTLSYGNAFGNGNTDTFVSVGFTETLIAVFVDQFVGSNVLTFA